MSQSSSGQGFSKRALAYPKMKILGTAHWRIFRSRIKYSLESIQEAVSWMVRGTFSAVSPKSAIPGSVARSARRTSTGLRTTGTTTAGSLSLATLFILPPKYWREFLICIYAKVFKMFRYWAAFSNSFPYLFNKFTWGNYRKCNFVFGFRHKAFI